MSPDRVEVCFVWSGRRDPSIGRTRAHKHPLFATVPWTSGLLRSCLSARVPKVTCTTSESQACTLVSAAEQCAVLVGNGPHASSRRGEVVRR